MVFEYTAGWMPVVVSEWCPTFPLPCRMQYFLYLPQLHLFCGLWRDMVTQKSLLRS